LVGTRANAGLLITLSAPDVQSTQVANATTETFNSYSPGLYTTLNSNIGTYTSGENGIAIVSPNQYGGSNSSQYAAIGAESWQTSMTLTLESPAAYFGFEWLAGDRENEVSFYSGATLLGSYDVGNLISFINALPNASSYYGNPNNGEDGGEPFAYVNVTDTSGAGITSVVFSNMNSFSTGFELDNNSIASSLNSPPPGIPVASIPEPSSIVLGLLGFAGGAVAYARKRLHFHIL
jgi:hypothetical protein